MKPYYDYTRWVYTLNTLLGFIGYFFLFHSMLMYFFLINCITLQYYPHGITSHCPTMKYYLFLMNFRWIWKMKISNFISDENWDKLVILIGIFCIFWNWRQIANAPKLKIYFHFIDAIKTLNIIYDNKLMFSIVYLFVDFAQIYLVLTVTCVIKYRIIRKVFPIYSQLSIET